jgi:hypothetical protein
LEITHLWPCNASEAHEMAKANKAVALGYAILGLVHFTTFFTLLHKT